MVGLRGRGAKVYTGWTCSTINARCFAPLGNERCGRLETGGAKGSFGPTRNALVVESPTGRRKGAFVDTVAADVGRC